MRRIIEQASLIALKDTRILLADPRALFFVFLVPLIFVAGFTLTNESVARTGSQFRPLFVTQEAADGLSQRVIQVMTTGGDVPVRTAPYADALRALESGEEAGFVSFPPDFTDALTRGRPTAIEVVAAGGDPFEQTGLEGVARALAAQLSAVSVATQAIAELRQLQGQDAGTIDVADLQSTGNLVEFTVERVGEIEPVRSISFTLTGYLTMFVFFVAAVSAEGIASERENRTLERLMASGVRRESIVLGKYLAAVYRGLAQLVVLWTAGMFIFQVNLGAAPWAVALVSLLMVFASASVGLVLATIAKTHQSASSLAVLTSLVLAPIGGCWWPLFITPGWVQTIARLTPHGWANIAFNKLLVFGADGGDVLLEMAALAVYGVVLLTIAFVRFRQVHSVVA